LTTSIQIPHNPKLLGSFSSEGALGMGLAVTYYDLYRRKIKEKGLREKEYYFITTANFLDQ
jgi:hypothetical protein